MVDVDVDESERVYRKTGIDESIVEKERSRVVE